MLHRRYFLSHHSLVSVYKNQFESYLRNFIPNLCDKNFLRDACEYALLNGGKRVRPITVLIISQSLGVKKAPLDASLCVEFFHTSSLIADDLPCMDNDDYRRGNLSTHKVFGEAVAVLASYALLNQAFEMIQKIMIRCTKEVGHILLSCATKGAGLLGATGGQFLDLFPMGKDLLDICQVIEMKTITLFELSFLLGFLCGGGKISQVEKVKKAAYHFGMAFQIADDFRDKNEDGKFENSLNIVAHLGEEKSYALLEKEILCFEQTMRDLGIFTPEFQELVSKLVPAFPS